VGMAGLLELMTWKLALPGRRIHDRPSQSLDRR
jgi:hypothetical protein